MSQSIDKIIAPPALTNLRGWLCWRLEKRDTAKKPLKISYYANGRVRYGTNGSPEDRAQLVDFETAKKAAIALNMTGVGFAPLEGFGVTLLDFDDCVKDGEVDFSVAVMVSETYAEFSPSGNGVHAIVLGELGNRKSHATADRYGFETFTSKNYVTFTGNTLPLNELVGSSIDLKPPSEGVMALFNQRFGERVERDKVVLDNETLGLSNDELHTLLHALPNDLGYADWLNTGMAVHHETNGEGFDLWDDWSALSPNYESTEYNKQKWESFGSSGSTNAVTARTLIKWANEQGAAFKQTLVTDADFEVIEESSKPTNFFKIRSIEDFLAQAKPLEWLIKGFLPKATLGVLYGESGSGKSFLALDICQALIRGKDWNGLKSKPVTRILYVAAEGVGGFANRVRAYFHQQGIDAIDQQLDVISDAPPNLTDPANVHLLIQDIASRGGYDLIVIDTFAQVTPGANENSGEDMGRALAYCRRISAVARGMVLLVHHSGKDASKGARGWSGVHAASDVVFEVARDGEQRSISVTKQKDGSDGNKYGFKLLPVVLEQDEDGDDVTSCVIEYCEYKATEKVEAKKPKRLGMVESVILNTLKKNPSGMAHMSQDILVTEAAAKLPHIGEGRDKRKYRIERALENLCENGLVFIENGQVFILDADETSD